MGMGVGGMVANLVGGGEGRGVGGVGGVESGLVGGGNGVLRSVDSGVGGGVVGVMGDGVGIMEPCASTDAMKLAEKKRNAVQRTEMMLLLEVEAILLLALSD